MGDKEVKEFIAHMKEEIARIPKNLTADEYRDRSERCLSLSETFRESGERMKAKKYQLLSQKYKQLEHEKRFPRPVVKTEAPAIIIEEPVKQEEEKSGFIGFFKNLFGRNKKKPE